LRRIKKLRSQAWYGQIDLIVLPQTHIQLTVFALFRASVQVIDSETKTKLSRMLVEGITATAPGEKLDEKLAALSFNGDVECE
jgi:hypothetical protein